MNGSDERVPELQVSVSQVKTYLRCPESYRLRYILGEKPAFLPVPLAFGTAFHAALAAYFSAIKTTGSVPLLEQVQSVFVDSWSEAVHGPVPLQQEEDDDALDDQVDKGRSMLAAYYDHTASQPLPVVEFIEKRFAVPLHDPVTGEVLEEKLSGVIDLVILEDDYRVIVEHKSAAKKYSLDQLRFDIQPTCYQHAAELLGWGEVGLRFNIVTKTKKPAVQEEVLFRDEQAVEEFLHTTVGVLRAIDAGAFWPQRGWQCKGCQYGHACGSRR